jgi:uncharacterized membrane protein
MLRRTGSCYSPGMKARPILRTVMALFYAIAGILHLLKPRPFVSITPHWVPAPDTVVALTGLAELLGAIGLLQPLSPRLRQAAGWGLATYALCVWPANVNHMVMDLAKPDHGAGLGYHIPRMFAQPLLIWAALWASGAIEWPFRRR